eukprot:3344321-Prymnesium_polylepis.1
MGAPHMGRLTHHNTPGPVSGGHAATAWVMQSSSLWKQAEWGEEPTHACPNAVTRPAAGRHH